MSIKRIADQRFISQHEYNVSRAVSRLEDSGYEVYDIQEVKRPLFGWDVLFSGNITDIHYREKTNGDLIGGAK